MTFLTEQQLIMAADWWIAAFKKPKFDNGGDGIASLLASRLASSISEIQEQAFRTAFCSFLKQPRFQSYPALRVDYSPEGLLREIMLEADIPFENAPWKTRMSFDKEGHVFVKHGYISDEVQLF